TQTLSGTGDNAGGKAQVDSGTLILGKTSTGSVHSVGTNNTVGLTINGGTARLGGTGNDQLYTNTNVSQSGGVFDFNGTNEGFRGLTGTGGVVRNEAASTASLMTVGEGSVLADTYSYAGAIQSGPGTMALTKVGDGTQTLTGANTYTGTTTVSGGTLELSGTGALTQTSDINITGGTLLVGSTAGDRLNNSASVNLNRDSLSSAALGFSGTVTETTGALSLLSDSVIDMGGGDADITFASFSVTAGKKLAVWNWTGTLWNINGTDRLLFTSGTAGTDFADVQFYSDNGATAIGSGAKFLTNGGIVELVPVPEPGAVAAAGLLLGVIGWRGRRSAVRSRTV
ncbi:MAG: autotransporter-associated beta strand repeat-containing protein, partial [Verrucomicrobiales bacterium]|nr:autotransporter-associated beta strand repeat-containing protein [Verrucomicrobiales bacterium]